MPQQQPAGYGIKPQALFLTTLCAVFVGEVAVMFILSLLPEFSELGEALLDACLLSLLVAPFLYLFFLKPYQRSLELRQQTEFEHRRTQAIDRMKSEFISVAAHELRTPLATIMGYSELLLDKKAFDESQQTEFATIIIQKAETMSRLIDDLLDLNRIELGQPLRIEKGQHDIVMTVSMLLDEYRKKHPGREFNVTLPATPVVAAFDKVRIEQVLDNLLSNAIKFSPPTTAIAIAGAVQGEFFQVQVRDGGIGMAPEELGQAFDKFYRADSSDTAPPGLGLGLAIVREIIASHGGGIWLESTPGQGTTAYFTLPLAPS